MKTILQLAVLLLAIASLAFSQEPGESSRLGSTARSTQFGRSAPPPAAMPKSAGKAIAFDFLIAEFSGTAVDVTADKVLELEKDGKLSGVQRFQVNTLEDLPAFVQVGELAARVTGRTIVGGRGFGGPGGTPGPASTPIYNDIHVGSLAQVTARIEEDGSILAQIYIERSTLPPAARDAATASDAPPPRVVRTLTQSTVRLKPGVANIVSGRKFQSADENLQSWIIVKAALP